MLAFRMCQTVGRVMFCLRMYCLIAVAILPLSGVIRSANSQPAPASDDYTARVQSIFDGRCIACHSCYNAPWQLKLQSHSGLARGATKFNVYDGSRPTSVAPSRLDIDGHSVPDWRAKGFFDVVAGTEPARTLLMQLVSLRARHPTLQPKKPVGESNFCPADSDNAELVSRRAPEIGMPYGLPPLSQAEIGVLGEWIARGAPGPSGASLESGRAVPPELQAQVRDWEAFLNGGTSREMLMARYLYEHLFLAHLYFTSGTASQHPAFFRLVRSRTPCEARIDEIATRRPNDDPGPGGVQYCLRRLDGTIVDKIHIPYDLSPEKLERIRRTFLAPQWDVKNLPGYADETAGNPFVTFADIPVRARYQFLLDDAEYEISTFIKGPVCNGSIAVNSIQEQFFVFFLRPDADNMVMSPEYARQAQDLLILPGVWGSDVPILDGIPFFQRRRASRGLPQIQGRRGAQAAPRRLHARGHLERRWPQSKRTAHRLPALRQRGRNARRGGRPAENAVRARLLAIRAPGLQSRGQLRRVRQCRPPGADPALHGSDPDGGGGAVPVLPAAAAAPGTGPLTDLKLRYVFPLVNDTAPTAIVYRNVGNAKAELVERVINEHLAPQVRGRPDALNWKALRLPRDAGAAPALTAAEQALRRIASIKAADATPFARFFPELAVVQVRNEDGSVRLYSLVHNREHANVSWMLGELDRLARQEDSLTVRAGLPGAYPNMFFVVPEAEIDAFSSAIARIKSATDYERLIDRFGVRRSTEKFWSVYDAINSAHLAIDPVRSGTLDLTRYALEEK
jgi:Fatty acid cis/trans isomerase (CTI)